MKKLPWKRILGESVIVTILTIALSVCWPNFLQFFSLDSYYQPPATEKEFPASIFQSAKAERDKDRNDTASVTIVNTGYMTKREDIASLLAKIASMNPEMIGVDILFKDYHQSSEDSILVSVVDTIKDKTIFVCALNKDQVVHSFFCSPDKPDCYIDGVSEGLSELLYDQDKKSIYNFRYNDIINGDTLPTLAAQMTKDYIVDKIKDTDDHIIRYEKLKFSILTPDSLKEDEIHNNLVIVGTIDDGQDQHLTPLGILSGIEVHGQIVHMIRSGEYVKKAGWFVEIICSFILLFVFVFILLVIDYWVDYLHGKKEKRVLLDSILEIGFFPFILSVIFIVLAGILSYYMYVEKGILLNMYSMLIGITMLVLFIKLIVRFISKKYFPISN